MKRKNVVLALVFILVAVTAFKIADDIVARLGMDHRYAQSTILQNIIGRFSSGPMESYREDDSGSASSDNSFKIPYAKLLKDVIAGDKVETAKDLSKYVRNYVNSEEFMAEYNMLKEDAMPLVDMGSSLSTLRKNKIVFEKNIRNYKTDTKYVAEQQKQMDENQKQLDKLVEAAKKPFPGKEMWEQAYPANPSAIIKKRLQEYLQIVATVDFNAKLTAPDKYKITKFVNPAYEKKSDKWKAIFRAGKDVNDVVIPFVKEWLSGEIIAANKIKMTENASTVKNNNQTNNNQTKVKSVNNSETTSTDSTAKPVKEKKSILNKLKDKTKGIIKNY